jgi:heme exporter protein D
MNVFGKLIPSWIWFAAIGSLLALLGVQQLRVEHQKTLLAEERQARATETGERNRAALRESERVAGLQFTHAAQQQEIVDVYTQIVQRLEGRIADDAAHADRLSRQFAASAARDREAARGDPAACRRIADRSEVLAGAAAEGGQLLIEARRALKGRDAELTLLLNLVRNDRRLMDDARPPGEQ